MKKIFILLLISAIYQKLNAQIPSYVPKYSLIGWWELNGNVIDKSKNKLNGASYGATQSTDRFGNTNSCYKFNGVSDYLEIPHNSLLDCPNSITLSCWINSEDVLIKQRILDKATGGTSNGWLLDLSPTPSDQNKIRCIIGGSKTNLPYSKNEIKNNNNWYHIVVTYNKSIVKFYINGALSDSTQLTTSTPSTTHPVIIGTTTSKVDNFFKGKIDDLGIWNRALEYSEIIDLYNASSCGTILATRAQVPGYLPTDSLKGWWPFNGNANDESGNGNNGTVNGANLTTDRFGKSNKAYSFNGVSNSITLQPNTNIQGNKPRSISAWFTLSGKPNYTNTIFKGGDNGIGKDFSIWLTTNNNGMVRIHIRRYIDDIITSFFSIKANQWYNLIVTYDGTNDNAIKIFLDGKLINTYLVAPTGLKYNTASVQPVIGVLTDQLNVNHFFYGNIDDVAIWNRALDTNEIKALYMGCEKFAISQEPSNQTSKINDNVFFSTLANDTTISYQWQSNASNLGWTNIPANNWYSGDQSKKLTVKNIKLINHKQLFRVIAFKNSCNDTSNSATLTVLDTCINILNDTISVQDTLIINAKLTGTTPLKTNLIKVYPNPAKEYLVIDFGNYASMAGYEINIVDVTGKSVYSSAISKALETIDLNTWTGKGIYFIKIFDKQGNRIENRKIVIQ